MKSTTILLIAVVFFVVQAFTDNTVDGAVARDHRQKRDGFLTDASEPEDEHGPLDKDKVEQALHEVKNGDVAGVTTGAAGTAAKDTAGRGSPQHYC